MQWILPSYRYTPENLGDQKGYVDLVSLHSCVFSHHAAVFQGKIRPLFCSTYRGSWMKHVDQPLGKI